MDSHFVYLIVRVRDKDREIAVDGHESVRINVQYES